MFLGQYEHSIDEKGRLTIPFRFRSVFENGLYVMRGFECNLMLMCPNDFQFYSEKVARMNMANPTARDLKRWLFSYSEFIKPDDAWRILIPQTLRQLAKLNSSVIVAGAGEYIEVWSPEEWANQTDKLNDTEVSSQRFADLDLSK